MLQFRYSTIPSSIMLENLLDDLFMFPKTETQKTTTQPVHDIIENEDEFIIDFHLSGIKKEDVTIDVDKDTLIVKVERKEVKDIKYNRKESFTGTYQKSFTLPDTIDKENIAASFVDGILTTIIPKIKKSVKIDKKKIEIK